MLGCVGVDRGWVWVALMFSMEGGETVRNVVGMIWDIKVIDIEFN